MIKKIVIDSFISLVVTALIWVAFTTIVMFGTVVVSTHTDTLMFICGVMGVLFFFLWLSSVVSNIRDHMKALRKDGK